MTKENNVPHNDYSVDEILAEARVAGEKKTEPAPPEKKPARAPLGADGIVSSARRALNLDAETADEPAPPPKKKPERKKKRPFFSRRKEEDDTIPEDDIYYGLQLKSLEEYKKDYEATISLDTNSLRAAEEQRLRKAVPSPAQKSVSAEMPEHPAAAKIETPTPAPEPVSAEIPEHPAVVKIKAPSPAPEPVSAETPEHPAAAKIKAPSPAPEPVTAETPVPPQQPAAALEKSQAVSADGNPFPDDRRDLLEKILRHVGLGTEDVVCSEESAPKPEFPVRLPHPPMNPAVPPVPPAVEPGPPLEPEQEPPIQEPPLEPSPSPTAEGPSSEPENTPEAATKPEAAEMENPPEATAEKAESASVETSAEPEETRTEPVQEPTAEKEESAAAETSAEPEEKAPAAIREPVATPREKDETPAPPAAKEPPRKEFPHYRATVLPLHVIELGAFDDALSAEADGYAPPPIHAPEPIPFPADRQEETPEFSASGTPAENAPGREPERTGNISPLPLPERPPETKKAKKRFRIFGSDEDPAPPDGPPEETGEELEDYSAPADAPSVLNDLMSNVRRLLLRFTAMCLFTLLAAGSAVVWEQPALLPGVLHNLHTAQNCLIVQLILIVASAVFCMPTIRNGLWGLFRLQANSDSAAAVAVLAAAVQNTVFLLTGFPANCRLYSSLAVFALLLDTAGKLSMSKRILRNFRFLTSPEEKYAVQTFDDYNTAIQMTKTLAAGGPKIAYQTKAGFLCRFLKHSYASDPGEHVSQFLAPAGFLGSFALCIAAAVLTKDPSAALTAFTASACLCVPFGASLSVNLPLARLSRVASRFGGMAVGWDAVERFSGTDAVLLDAQDLFPRGTVQLNGIQTFAGQRIDEAILDATALTEAVGGTLSDLFSQIVKARGEVLPHVERPVYEEGLGISGTVADRIILVGRGELLKRHGVDAPSRDYEEKYLRSGKIPVYLASGGLLVAMFLVFYRSDRRRAAELRRLESNGIGLLVRTRDPNVTPELISDCFGLSRHSVAVLPERLGNVYASLQAHPPERVSAVLATKGRATSMMRLLTACVRQRGNVSVGIALQTAGAALGFALAAFFTGCSGLSQLSATALLLFEAFWAAAVVLIPKIRRP